MGRFYRCSYNTDRCGEGLGFGTLCLAFACCLLVFQMLGFWGFVGCKNSLAVSGIWIGGGFRDEFVFR